MNDELTVRTQSATPVWLMRHSGSWPSCADRKSTRLNSSHSQISYAVFCLKKKKKNMKVVLAKLLIDDNINLRTPCITSREAVRPSHDCDLSKIVNLHYLHVHFDRLSYASR